MSLVVSWIGIDTHGVASAYITSESRITWKKKYPFDYCKKVFASNTYPEIFGYAGDVLFPSIVLSQIVAMIDSNILFTPNMTCAEKNKIVFKKILYTLNKYPYKPYTLGKNPVQIMHISRDTIVNGYPEFHMYLLHYYWPDIDKKKRPVIKEIPIPTKSDVLQVLGTGKTEFLDNYNNMYNKSVKAYTSRNVFHCFIYTLNHTTNNTFGGPPQLVGLYRKPLTSGINFGIIYNRKRYFLGMEVPKECAFDQVPWRNARFELCSGITKMKIDKAQSQPDTI